MKAMKTSIPGPGEAVSVFGVDAKTAINGNKVVNQDERTKGPFIQLK